MLTVRGAGRTCRRRRRACCRISSRGSSRSVLISMLENISVDALCVLKVWSAQCLNWSTVTRAHAPRQAYPSSLRVRLSATPRPERVTVCPGPPSLPPGAVKWLSVLHSRSEIDSLRWLCAGARGAEQPGTAVAGAGRPPPGARPRDGGRRAELRGDAWARSRCRFVLPLTHFIPDSIG